MRHYVRTVCKKLTHSPTVASWVGISGRIAGVAILIPIAFRVLSPTDAVLWMFFFSVINFQNILDFGFNTTFCRYIAYSRASNKSDAAQGLDLISILSLMKKSYRRLILCEIFIAIPIISYFAKKPIEASSNPQLHWLTWSLVCLSLLSQTYGGRYTATLQGFEKVPTQRWIEALIGVLGSFFSGIILLNFGSLAFSTLSTALIGIIGTISYSKAAEKLFSIGANITHKKNTFNNVVAGKSIWNACWKSGIGVLFSTGMLQTIPIIVSNYSAPEKAAPFMFAMRVAQTISILSQSPFYSYLPRFARLYKDGHNRELKSEALRKMLFANLVIATGFLFLGIAIPKYIELTGSQFSFVDSTLWALLGVSFLIERSGAMHMQLYTLGGNVIWHWANGMTGLCIAFLLYFLMPAHGLIAVPVSIGAAYLSIYCLIAIPRSHKLLKLPALFDITTAGIPLLIILICFVA